jgi:hypothetical protein
LFCLRLIPGLDPPRIAPEVVPFDSLAAGGANAEGFIRADLAESPIGGGLALGGAPLPVRPTPGVAWALNNAYVVKGVRSVFAHVKRTPGGLVCDRLVEVPRTRPTFALWFQIARFVVLCGVATAWWYAFTMPWDK